jgi:hypothetical protein
MTTPSSTIMRSVLPVQVDARLEYLFLITAESGEQFQYSNPDFVCDLKTHMELACETTCIRCPVCQQILCRTKEQWHESAEGLGFMRLSSKEDAEIVLRTFTEEDLEKMPTEQRLTAYKTKSHLLELLGRGPEMLDTARKAYALEKNAGTAHLMAQSHLINGMLEAACDHYQEALQPSSRGEGHRNADR